MDLLDIDIVTNNIMFIGQSNLNWIVKSFQGKNTVVQGFVLKYEINLYFQEFSLAVYCDEYSCKDRNIDKEKAKDFENVLKTLLLDLKVVSTTFLLVCF